MCRRDITFDITFYIYHCSFNFKLPLTIRLTIVDGLFVTDFVTLTFVRNKKHVCQGLESAKYRQRNSHQTETP